MLVREGVIPPSLLSDLSDPGIAAEGLEPFGCQLAPCSRDVIEDRVVVRVNTMREVALSQVEPDALDRVQFRCIGRQAEQRHVGRHHKIMAGVPACTVQHHQSVFVGRQTGCELPQERVHRGDRDARQEQAEVPPCQGFDGGKGIGEGISRSDALDRKLAASLAAVAGALNAAAFYAVGFFSANMTGNRVSRSE